LLDDYNLNPDKIIIKYDTLLNYQELLNGDHLPLNHDKKDIVCGYTQWDKTYVIRKYHSSMSLSSWLWEKDRALKEERDDEQKKQKFESTVKQNLADFFNWWNEWEDEDNF
jgi:hypothetical protein